PEVAETLRKELIKAAALGTNYNQISRKLLQTAQISKQRAMMITRTEVNRLRRETTRQIYERNSKHIEAWEWLAVKSAKTCILCLAMDGKIFELKKPFPQH
ncbi:phage minor head protein, partial [Vibrio parahaemolyticus]|uniref:phage minor head protein n=1 Tax=Vibrio parahaemolyticus TaxID=670 RepID=UPI00146DA473